MALTKVSTGLISADLASVDLNIDANTLYIDVTNNRVGINNTGPATALDVTGTVTADGLTVDGNATITTADNNAQLTVVSTDADAGVGPRIDFYRNSGSPANGDLLGEIQFQGEDSIGSLNIFATISAKADQVDNGAEDGSLRFKTLINGSLAERLIIDAAGNVGIGTTSPNAALDVLGSSGDQLRLRTAETEEYQIGRNASTGLLDFYGSQTGFTGYTFGGVDGERMRIDSSGNVGIGTTPKSWASGFTALQIGGLASFYSQDSAASAGVQFTQNGYYDGSWKYMITDEASRYFMGDGTHRWFTASSGTADTAISWSEAMRIDSSGNLLVGTTTQFPGVSGLGGNIKGMMSEGGGSLFLSRVDSNPVLYVNRGGTDGDIVRFSKDAATVGSIGTVSGLLGIGSGDAILAFDGTGNAMYPMSSQTGGASDGVLDFGSSLRRFKDLYLSGSAIVDSRFLTAQGAETTGYQFQGDGDSGMYQEASNQLQFSTAGSERMRIDSSGNLLVGSTSGSVSSDTGFKVNNAAPSAPYIGVVGDSTSATSYSVIHHYNVNATLNGFRFYVTNNGGIYNYSANNVNLSDERVKTNIVDAGNYLNKICAIPVRVFNYKDEPEGTNPSVGVIAQEVKAVAPELVNDEGFGETPDDGIPLKSVYTTDMMYALMKCIQEQQDLIESLTARIAALEGVN